MEGRVLVYTWCDSADPVWNARRLATMEAFDLVPDPAANAACRYAANDELRYSLRSAERCVPWVRRVFLVIADDATPPKWLRLDHRKLQIVRLGEILPDPSKPCFCSDAIEHRLAFIPGLSERYLLSNDDTFFARPLSPGFFYARDGYPFFRFAGERKPSGAAVYPTYVRMIENAAGLVREAFGGHCAHDLERAFVRYPHHNVDAYAKSDVLDAYERYARAIAPMYDYPFRRPEHVQRVLYAYDAIARGHGHFRLAVFRVKERRPWWKRLLRPGYADSLQFFGEGWRDGPAMLRKWRPGLFCFNDTERSSAEDRDWLRKTLSSLFPVPSSFEKEGA